MVPRVKVSADGDDVVSHAGVGLLREVAELSGLTGGVSAVLADTYKGPWLHDPGRVFTDLAAAVADAQSERKAVMSVDVAFRRWNAMLTNPGDNYANQERFLRHYYNAFKAELPQVARAPLAAKASLIRIYEALIADDIQQFIDKILPASAIYGRITAPGEGGSGKSDVALRQLTRAQGAPSYMLLLWLMTKRDELSIQETQLVRVTELLTNFFVRRNLTGHPQTY